jgi:hypothetical protein
MERGRAHMACTIGADVREENEWVSGKNWKFWSQMTPEDDWNGAR